MSTLYKVYMEVLAKRLRKNVEGKRVTPGNQTDFRKGLETIDNIYVINYLVNRQLGKKKGSLVALFSGFEGSFDSVDKGVLVETMKEREIRAGLVQRVKETIKETRNRVVVGGKAGEDFWTAKGVRQGLSVKPVAF